jgi:hypothetical protein
VYQPFNSIFKIKPEFGDLRISIQFVLKANAEGTLAPKLNQGTEEWLAAQGRTFGKQ